MADAPLIFIFPGSYVTHETKHFIYFYLGAPSPALPLPAQLRRAVGYPTGRLLKRCVDPAPLRPSGSAALQVRLNARALAPRRVAASRFCGAPPGRGLGGEGTLQGAWLLAGPALSWSEGGCRCGGLPAQSRARDNATREVQLRAWGCVWRCFI